MIHVIGQRLSMLALWLLCQIAAVIASIWMLIAALAGNLIAEAMQQRIRSVYSLEDEQYFARIGVGAALGVYAFQPGEQEALTDTQIDDLFREAAKL